MPERLHKDMREALAEARGLFEELLGTGLNEIDLPQLPAHLPLCPPLTAGADRGGEAVCRTETLDDIRRELEECRRCKLCKGRKNIVFGVGDPHARLVLVGEAPGREEDERGEPFVGEAGRLLDRILFAMGLRREEVYICNVEKCRPPNNRDPEADEIAACEPYLQRQLAVIRPQVIVALGRFSAQTLLRSQEPIGQLRGIWHEYQGSPLMATYHPAYLLRNPIGKREVWEDMKLVQKRLRGNR
jgi:uracil-DNA glycosylase